MNSPLNESDTTSQATGEELTSLIESRLDRESFQDHHWEGSFFDYLDICAENPGAVRNAYQRLYDAIMSFGSKNYRLFKRDCVRYHFFSDPFADGADGVYGLDLALMQLVLIGIVGLKYGADFIVFGAVSVATIFGISERVIGLTIIAIGTSLPEIATAVVAARRNQPDIAVGNIIGSNIFNVLAVVGVTAVVQPITVNHTMLLQDGTVMVLAALLMLPVLRTGQVVSRKEGCFLLTLYAAYMIWTVFRGE